MGSGPAGGFVFVPFLVLGMLVVVTPFVRFGVLHSTATGCHCSLGNVTWGLTLSSVSKPSGGVRFAPGLSLQLFWLTVAPLLDSVWKLGLLMHYSLQGLLQSLLPSFLVGLFYP